MKISRSSSPRLVRKIPVHSLIAAGTRSTFPEFRRARPFAAFPQAVASVCSKAQPDRIHFPPEKAYRDQTRGRRSRVLRFINGHRSLAQHKREPFMRWRNWFSRGIDAAYVSRPREQHARVENAPRLDRSRSIRAVKRASKQKRKTGRRSKRD